MVKLASQNKTKSTWLWFPGIQRARAGMQVKKQQRTEEVAQTRKAAEEIVEFLRAGS